MNAAMLPPEVIELVAEHLGLEGADELDFGSTDRTTTEIEAGWNECVRDLSHLPRAEKREVLQRTKPFEPRMIECDGQSFAVHLYDGVQVAKGEPRVNAAVVDCGDNRFVAMGL